MTDTTDQADDQANAVEAEEPVDLLSLLTIDELNTGSRVLKASLVIAVTEKTENYERALAVLAYLHARRRDPQTKLAPYFALSFTDISDQLQETAKAHQGDSAGPLAQTSS